MLRRVAVLLLTASLAGCAGARKRSSSNSSRPLGAAVLAALCLALLLTGPASADPPPDKIAEVVARVHAAVVRIISVQPHKKPPAAATNAANVSGPGLNTLIGSGLIVDPTGLVVTNRHVVEDAVSVFVGTADGGRYQADLVVMAGETDIALLKISAGAPLPVVTLGDSDAVRVGQAVIAIGDPFGFGGSVSAGIVSATNRNIMESPFDDYIQTDAAINHGSSGGPLFDLSGQVIGMTSVLYAPGTYSGSAGVNFAIPSNLLSFVVPRLRDTGKVAAGMLPIRTQRVSELMAAAIGAPDPGGALVIALTAQAKAMAGAIQSGDIIKSFDGTTVLDPRDLARRAAAATIGSRVTLGLYRNGQMVSVLVPILTLTGDKATIMRSIPAKSLGLQLVAVSGSASKPGVTIKSIDPSGSVADSGLRAGDVILRVQRQLVFTPEQILTTLRAWAGAGHSYAALLVQRDKKQAWMPVALPAGNRLVLRS